MLEEIRSEIQKLKFSKEELKKFAVTMAVVLGLFSALAWWKSSPAFPYLIAVALLFLALGFIAPMALKQVYKGWMTIAIIMGFFMTKVILSLLFYTAFTVIGLIQRLSGKDILDEKMTEKVESYWKPYEKPKDMKRQMEKQF